MRFRKKPVEVEAMQFDGFNILHIARWSKGAVNFSIPFNEEAPIVAVIDTLEGRMTASIGDWIIRGIKGEYYPCKPNIFEATYELVT